MGVSVSEYLRRELLVLLVLTLASVFFFYPVFAGQVDGLHGDYQVHLNYAEGVINGSLSPHLYLFSSSIAGVHAFLPKASVTSIGLAVLIVHQAAAILIVYGWLRYSVDDIITWQYRIILGGLALGLIAAAPIIIFTTDSAMHMYFGYIPLAVYHNPPMILLRPYALTVFWLAVRAFDGESHGIGTVLLTIVLMILSVLAKPNFALALIPAVVIYGMWQVFLKPKLMIDVTRSGSAVSRWKRTDVRLIAVGIILAALPVLVVQYSTIFNPSDVVDAGGFKLELFGFIGAYEVVTWRIGAKFLLSMAFPIAVTTIYWRVALQDRGLQLAWLIFAVGAVYFYLLVESGLRAGSGNFTWSAMIGSSILFVVSATLLLQQSQQNGRWNLNDWRLWVSLVFLALHIISGILWASVNASGRF